MIDKYTLSAPEGLRACVNDAYRADEHSVVTSLIEHARLSQRQLIQIRSQAIQLVRQVRLERQKSTGIDSFLTEYSLSSDEGIALMCLAEALLRVPDNATIDSLIKDKLSQPNWESHRGQSHSFFVNATTWALMLTGKVLSPEKSESTLAQSLFKLMHQSGEGVLRVAVDKAMRIMSKQFVMGRTIKEAIQRAKKKEGQGYRYSYDMLGEAALTAEDADRYFNAYATAIEAIGESLNGQSDVYKNPGISIKLSALHPRYQEVHYGRVLTELAPKLLALAQLAKKYAIPLTVDAEESERLDVSLDVIERVFNDDSLHGWDGFGLAVQSYQKRAFYLLDWVAALARSKKRRIMVRLIKGAYWDSEIKKTQMQGLSDYPVFTRKMFTDVSFQACAKKLLTMTDAIYPQFATHNAYSVALILELVGDYRDFEFQCLHGMGNELYQQIVPSTHAGISCRIYAPVGSHEDLLPYLVRRLLENGANSSFVNRIVDEREPIEVLVQDPVAKASSYLEKINQNIPLPVDIFMPQRKNSMGFDFINRATREALQHTLAHQKREDWKAFPLVAGKSPRYDDAKPVKSPQNVMQNVGYVTEATPDDIECALTQALNGFKEWGQTDVVFRQDCLNRIADLYEANRFTLMEMACCEAGKTWFDADAEVREAVDFCRYYGSMAASIMGEPTSLFGYTGERNELSLHPRGVIVCISPWNFPLAIFTGQIVAALVTGNCVIAKPAEQTPLIAHFAIKLMHEAGVPEAVIQCLPGDGVTVGGVLVNDSRVDGVVFTGSTQTATRINQTLAARPGAIVPLIAETGGQNAMIVDSSALLEQVIMDVMTSAFGSAGQRCSALRVIYVQEEVYARFIQLLQGAMAELKVGDPAWLTTDVGPVIDEDALRVMQAHVDRMRERYTIIYQSTLDQTCTNGHFMPPTAIEIDSIQALNQEIFGPVLHVISYKRDRLDHVIAEINDTQYGLTLGVHSRINETVEHIRRSVRVGNCYVNRSMIGAVVGLQPFGGEGLSGTGPKAGGPHYLQRFCVERTYTVDTTAAGGNASLMSLPD